MSIYNQTKKVIVPESVNYLIPDFFPDTIEEIEININNKNYVSDKGKIHNKDKTILYMCISNENELTIEEGIKQIEAKAFSKTKSTIINLPDSLERINIIHL